MSSLSLRRDAEVRPIVKIHGDLEAVEVWKIEHLGQLRKDSTIQCRVLDELTFQVDTKLTDPTMPFILNEAGRSMNPGIRKVANVVIVAPG